MAKATRGKAATTARGKAPAKKAGKAKAVDETVKKTRKIASKSTAKTKTAKAAAGKTKKTATAKKAGAAKKPATAKTAKATKPAARKTAKPPALAAGKSPAKTTARAKAKTPTKKAVKSTAKTTKIVRTPAKKAAAKPDRARSAARTRVTGSTHAKRAIPSTAAVRTRKGSALPAGVAILGATGPRHDEVLTRDALQFVADLHRAFNDTRKRLLEARDDRQARFDAGELPDFLPATAHVRETDWKVAPLPADLLDRRVEITGPVDRKMIVNALNSGAKVFMADFEDANSPTWGNNLDGQINLKDYWSDRIDFTDPVSGKMYRVGGNPAVLIVRPRGWHLVERHVTVDGEPVSGSLFDFGLYFFHNAKMQIRLGTGPYFYLPKTESHLEARLWNDVFRFAQERLKIAPGTIKATVLIETLPAAFEMDEILYELRDHIAGLNAGRWDYIFSFIKKLAKNPAYILPDRSQVTMGKAFLRAYALLLIRTCHRRGAFAMGGMAAQIPVKNNPDATMAAFNKVTADKEREAGDGHDGTWVAHPDLVPVAMKVFDRLMPGPNQLDRLREDVTVTQADLLQVHEGTKTQAGFRENIRVGVQYLEAWLRGRGAVPIYNLMEDAATAEISRAQIWQWVRYGATLDDGTVCTPVFFRACLAEEMDRVKGEVGEAAFGKGRFAEAIDLFAKLSLAPEFGAFLTLPAYDMID